MRQGGRVVLSLILAGVAAGAIWFYATMPYELVTTTTTTTRAVPSGEGFLVLSFILVVASLVAAFSGDWD